MYWNFEKRIPNRLFEVFLDFFLELNSMLYVMLYIFKRKKRADTVMHTENRAEYIFWRFWKESDEKIARLTKDFLIVLQSQKMENAGRSTCVRYGYKFQ